MHFFKKKNFHGLTEENTMGIMKKIKSMVLVLLFGQMVENTLEVGQKANNMGKENISWRMEKRRWENGWMAREQSGWTENNRVQS